MKNPSSRIPVLVFALLSTAGLLAQKGGSGAELTVSVKVAPICTVAVTPGEWTVDQAIDVRCRNLAISQPQPVISPASIATAHEGSAVGTDGDGGVAMIVINF